MNPSLSSKQILFQEASELVTQLHLYLMQEHEPHSRLTVSRESYLYYRNYAMSLNQSVKKGVISEPVRGINESPLARQVEEKTVQKSNASTTKQPVLLKQLGEHDKKFIEQDKKLIEQQEVSESKVLTSTTTKEKKVSEPKKAFIEQQSPINIQDLTDIQKNFSVCFPSHPLVSIPPDDSQAKALKHAWKKKKKKIGLVVGKIESKHHLFLSNLCKALKISYDFDVEVFEKNSSLNESSWLIELRDLDDYLQTPQLKGVLWNTIKENVLCYTPL